MSSTIPPAHLRTTKQLRLLNFNRSYFHFPILSLPIFTQNFPIRSHLVHRLVYSVPSPHSTRSSSSYFTLDSQSIFEILILLAFSLVLLCLRLLSNVFLPDFPARWQGLVAFSAEAEARTSSYPRHLRQSIVAYEDKRFFRHIGIDPVGIARAALSLSARGGGSTITQQLVKNIFLKNERTLLRKMVEMALAVALERTLSKERILSCYMNKIYWGHGIYGIELASNFFFKKHPSHLSLGESALLVGIIPAPELRSPLRDPSRGITFQARVLKRMVKVGFLDTETALSIVNEPLHLNLDASESSDGLVEQARFTREELEESKLSRGCTDSTRKDVWDWEKESKICEVRENMESWARQVRHKT